jgi:small subunit ribosomal protein S4
MKWVQARPFPPGQHGRNLRIKKSDYRIRLEEKQKLRFYYGLRERQLVRYINRAVRAKGNTGQTLLQFLEQRLDNTIFRVGFSPTIPAARQLVNHGHICVNGRKVDVASYEVRAGDVITVRDKEKSRQLVKVSLEAPSLSLPAHLDVNVNALEARVIDSPSRNALPYQISEQFVVEFYSQKV